MPPTSADDSQQDDTGPDGSGDDTFSREYVEKLRRENADARVKAKRADDLAERLLTATIGSTLSDRLADPADLLAHLDDPATLLDDDGLPDADKITAAANALLAAKPHLAPRRPTGQIDQGGGRPRVSQSEWADPRAGWLGVS